MRQARGAHTYQDNNEGTTLMSKIARISTAAFLAGVTTLSVTLPMPASARTGVTLQRIADLPVIAEPRAKDE